MKKRELSISNQLRILSVGDAIEFPIWMRDTVNSIVSRLTLSEGLRYKRDTKKDKNVYIITRII